MNNYFLAITLFLPIFVSKANGVNLDPKFVLLFISSVLFLLMIAGWMVSIRENEKRAANRFLLLALILPLPYLIVAFAEFSSQIPASVLMGVTTLMALVYIIPAGNNKSWRQAVPTSRIDERNTMFSTFPDPSLKLPNISCTKPTVLFVEKSTRVWPWKAINQLLARSRGGSYTTAGAVILVLPDISMRFVAHTY